MLHMDFKPNSSLSVGIDGEVVVIGVRCNDYEMLMKLNAKDARRLAVALAAAAKVVGTRRGRPSSPGPPPA